MPIGRRRGLGGGAAALVLVSSLAACGGGDSGGPQSLTWYINPDSGGQAEIASRCTDAAEGAYEIRTEVLPRDAAGQREQLIRRLAAEDSSIDIMSLDPPFIPEFAQAGFLADVPDDLADRVTEGVVESAIEGSTWNDEIVAVPFWANTQVLWYRTSVAEAAGLDMTQPVTWDQIIQAAQDQDVLIGAQGTRAESLTVWLNALIESAGGHIIEENADNPEDVRLGLDSDAGRRAAEVMRAVADCGQVSAAFSTENEDASATGFESDRGGFQVNYPFVYPRGVSAAEDGTLDQAVVDDYGGRCLPAGRRRHPGRTAVRRHQPRHRRLQRERRPRVRGGRVHRQRGEPGLLLHVERQPGLAGLGLRRPGGPRGVPAGTGHPAVAGAGRAATADRRTTARSPAACSASTTRRHRSTRDSTGPVGHRTHRSRPGRRPAAMTQTTLPPVEKTQPVSATRGGDQRPVRAERKLGWMLAGPAFVVMLAVTAYPIVQAVLRLAVLLPAHRPGQPVVHRPDELLGRSSPTPCGGPRSA